MTCALVAGATGYLGGFICRELKFRGYLVRALARSPEKLVPIQDSIDEIVEAEITRPETLEHIYDGIDMVFSPVGITRQEDGLTFRNVDYQGNKKLLARALSAGVSRFAYVSALNDPRLRHLAIVGVLEEDAHDIEVGGPQTLTWNEVSALAFEALGSPPRVSHTPLWLMKTLVHLVRVFNRHRGELLAFFTTTATTDVVAPPTGTQELEAHYRALGGTR